MKKILTDKIFHIIIITILAVGIFLRFKYFLVFRWLWADELSLLQNIFHASPINVFNHLAGEQASPPLFLLLTKFILFLFEPLTKYYVQTARFVPFIASIISIPAFYLLTKKYLRKKICLITANCMFCLNLHLIYFSQDFKQYSSDVCIFILVLLSYFCLNINKLSNKSILGLSLFYVICSWFSFTSILAATAVIAVMFSAPPPKSNLKKFLLLSIPFIISSILLYLNQHYLLDSKALTSFWENGFIHSYYPLSFFKVLYNAIQYYLCCNSFYINTVYILIFIFSIIKLGLRFKNAKSQILLLPLLFAFLASILKIYPFYLRTALYIYPIIIILFLYPFENIKLKYKYISLKSLSNFITYTMCLITIFLTIKYQNIFTFTLPNLKIPLSIYLKQNKSETLVMNRFDAYTYDFYNNLYKLNNNKNVIYLEDFSNQSLNMLPAGSTYYLINSISNEHPDLTSFEYRQKYIAQIIQNLGNTKIESIYNDENNNILIKFKK